MKLFSIIVLILAIFVCTCYSAPAESKDSPKVTKSAFGQPFDEIVVESSLTGLDYDPQYLKKPYVFNPDRFLPENKDGIVKGTFLPFGEGGRSCHGDLKTSSEVNILQIVLSQRFALIQIKVAVVHIVFNYDFKVFVVCLCLLLVEALQISGVPHNYDYRNRRSPQRTVMVSGYYGRPSHYSSEFNPEGGKYNQGQETDEIEIPVEENFNQDAAPTAFSPADSSEGQTDDIKHELADKNETPTKRNPKRKPVAKPQADEDEEDEGSWPFQLGRKGGPSYTAFFPIMFGGSGLHGRDSGAGHSGSATAIANSFSTGKGGVAGSHATAYGDPYVSTLLKGGSNGKKKLPQKEE
ncbi:hypothetical protein RN001_016440 [Aquatica leii]|uniref:Uncharacterized protein n=1 Tax=Aquatica leii TaxID=1421715 RepID=A0AAN7P1S6_9COLE|nr:hypothetical protein RN001_016440 [Aquatica leii]